ncbi:MAG: CHAT domain-containing protein [Oleiphilaceae bacterium]|jgi:CHAT domain-containing protein
MLATSPSIQIFLKVLSTISLMFLISACSVAPWFGCPDSTCTVSRFNSLGLEAAQEQGYLDGFSTIRKICNAFYEQQQYEDLQRCLDFYSSRINDIPYQTYISDKEEASIYDRLEFIRQTTNITNLEVDRLLDFNRCDDAYKLADDTLNLMIDEKVVWTFSEEYRELNRQAGIASACLGKRSIAENHINIIWSQNLGVFNRTENDVAKKHAVSDVFFSLGDYDKAERFLQGSNAMGLWDIVEVGVAIYSATHGGPGNVPALDYLHVADTYSKTGEVPPDQVIPQLYRLARSYEARGIYEFANNTYQILFSNKNVKVNLPHVYYPAIASYGFSLAQTKQSAKAIPLFEEFIEKIESNRQTINASTSQIGYMHDKYKVYDELIRLLIKVDRLEDAFEYAERSKARTLVDTLETKMSFGQKNNGSKSLLENLEALELNGSVRQTDKTRSQLLNLKSTIQQDFPELSSLISVPKISFSDLEKNVPKNTSLVFFYGNEDQLFGFVLDKGKLFVESLDAHKIHESAINYSVSLRSSDSSDYKQTSQKLYSLLFQPLEKHITEASLLIVPHGELNYLPFSALYDGNRFLIEKYSYSILPSLSIVSQLQRRSERPKTNNALILGNPFRKSTLNLEMSELEAQAISSIVISDTKLEGVNASETAFKELAKDYGLIHFAGHASFDEEYPLNSALLMSADAENDGALTLAEIYDMNLNADLVTLSACETGLGKVFSGDEVVSLTQGLLFAGANSIVSSLWKVSDEETGYLMLNFYNGMNYLPKYKALQEAQIEMIHNINEHPYYWAAFQYTGVL